MSSMLDVNIRIYPHTQVGTRYVRTVRLADLLGLRPRRPHGTRAFQSHWLNQSVSA